MTSILEVIENKFSDLGQTDYYAAILGESPSKGAKSPSLWNIAFKKLNLAGMMHPMDVTPDKLGEAVQCLREDNRFIGGAVTMPYKIDIIKYLDGVEPEAETTGAVNCIYRDGDKLIGANTDGAGALWSLENEMFGSIEGREVLILGTGGAGYAVASSLASAVGSEGTICLSNRTSNSRDELAGRLQGKCCVKTVDWPLCVDNTVGVDIVINCSSIGFEVPKKDSKGAFYLKCFTPLGSVDNTVRVEIGEGVEKRYMKAASDAIKSNICDSLEILESMESPFIFDIIYQPGQTTLLFLAGLLGYKTLNGASMNLEQAVIAFGKTTAASGMHSTDNCEIRGIMREVW